MPEQPLISIITPVLNGALWIEDCIQSVVIQDYPGIEHIIIDGGSSDDTLKICQKYACLIIHSGKDRGQSHAINKGFDMARGEILAWLCADDVYEPGAIQAAVNALRAERDVVMGHSTFVDAQLDLISEHPANDYAYYDHAMFLRFWKYHPISQPATFWTRKIWESCGGLDEKLDYTMDYDLWLRMSREARFELIDVYMAKYRVHAEAKCSANRYISRQELIEVSRRYWPCKWKPAFWKLFLHYKFTRGPLTPHYIDGERLLYETVQCLNDSQRWKAIRLFIKMHRIHPAALFFYDYKLTFKRILKEAVGPAWFWHSVNKGWRAFKRFMKN